MMRKKNIRYTVWMACMCLLLCSCAQGETKETILIGSGESQEIGGALRESDAADGGKGNTAEKSAVVTAIGIEQSGADVESGVQEEMIRVYVCGAVVNSGVVSVPAGSRVEDALIAAGGFSEEAGRETVNLADWIVDGQMLYFPTKEEAEEIKTIGTTVDSGLVNINTADAAQLCTLPGIGESRAADIVAYREKYGMFESCEDIMKVSGIKTSVYEKICDKITVK